MAIVRQLGNCLFVSTAALLIACSGGDGTDGVDGKNGVDGVDGVDGVNGTDGAKGNKGDPGDPGDPAAKTPPRFLDEKRSASIGGTVRASVEAVRGHRLWTAFAR